MFNIVLVEPRMPQNVGNIGRTCVATGSSLHIVHPIPFLITDKNVKRAGLDYWKDLDLHEYTDIYDFFRKTQGGRYIFATTKADKTYADIDYQPGDYILFGREDKGLSELLLLMHPETSVRIPMINETRSLNLSNSVAILTYEAFRQHNFKTLNEIGHLTKY